MRSKRLATALVATIAAASMAAPAADAKKRTTKTAKADPLYELVCTSLGLGKAIGNIEATLAPIVRIRIGLCKPQS